jgi:hypothetical protein
LKEKNREKRSGKDLHEISRLGECVQICHDEHIIAGTIQVCRCFRGKKYRAPMPRTAQRVVLSAQKSDAADGHIDR